MKKILRNVMAALLVLPLLVSVFGVATVNADDAARSFKAGHIIADDAPDTIADGLKVPLKDLTWHFVSNYVTDILTATEEEIVAAMKLTWTHMKIVIEPSCAVPLAVILKNKDVFAGKKVGETATFRHSLLIRKIEHLPLI